MSPVTRRIFPTVHLDVRKAKSVWIVFAFASNVNIHGRHCSISNSGECEYDQESQTEIAKWKAWRARKAKNGERKMGNRKQDEIILFYFQIHLHLWKVLIHSLCGNRATFSSCHNACDPRWVPLRNNTAIRVTSRHSWRHTEQIVDHYSYSPCDKPSYHSNVCL